MNYNKISDVLTGRDPLFTLCPSNDKCLDVIKTGLDYLIKTLKLFPSEISSEWQAEAAFIDLITTHFLSDKQCGVIGRIPTKVSHWHLSAKYMEIHRNAHPAWRYQSQIIIKVLGLFSCGDDSYHKTLYGIYRDIGFFISECDRYYNEKEIKQFLSATVSIMCYYISILEKGGCNDMWNPIQKRKTYKSNYNKLRTLLTYASELIETNWDDPSPVFTLIKILADKITLDNALNLLTTNQNPIYPQSDSFFIRVNPNLNPKYNISREVAQALYMNSVEIETTIDLSKDPVLVFPWNHERLVSCMSHIGSYGNPWLEDTMNHRAKLFLPMGITFVHNGMHSTFTGMVKREGTLNISVDNYYDIVDISGLYDLLQFDGTNYLIAGSDVIAGTAMSFEFGCIFEIGRMLYEKGICFKNLYHTEHKKE